MNLINKTNYLYLVYDQLEKRIKELRKHSVQHFNVA